MSKKSKILDFDKADFNLTTWENSSVNMCMRSLTSFGMTERRGEDFYVFEIASSQQYISVAGSLQCGITKLTIKLFRANVCVVHTLSKILYLQITLHSILFMPDDFLQI